MRKLEIRPGIYPGRVILRTLEDGRMIKEWDVGTISCSQTLVLMPKSELQMIVRSSIDPSEPCQIHPKQL